MKLTLNSLIAILAWPFLAVVYAVDWLITRLERAIGHRQMPYFFLLPNLAIFAIFILLPVMLNFFFGFTTGDRLLPQDRPFVGLDNFQRLSICQNYLDYRTCEEDFFWRAIGNSVKYVALEVPAMVTVAMMIALALNRQIIARGFFRSAFFYPVLLSPVVVAIIWKWMLQDRTGLLNTVLSLFGGRSIDFLTDPNWAFFWVIFVSVWAQVGFYSLILLAGLQSIPPVLYEAATIDGANGWSTFTRVTLPLLRPTLLVVLVLTMIRSVQAFDFIYAMTGGGPGTATTLTVQYIYRTAFGLLDYGLAAAASLIMAIALAGLTIAQLFLNRRQTEAA
jgi:alpha-1,4-digalacturonate transport system permease protein